MQVSPVTMAFSIMSQMLLKWQASMGCCFPSSASSGRLLLLTASRLSWWIHIAPTWWSSWLITSPVATVSSVEEQSFQVVSCLAILKKGKTCGISTFGYFDDMANTEPMAHMMKGLVPRIAPLIYVITGAGPDQVVQSIIACSFEVKNKTNRKGYRYLWALHSMTQ